MTNGSWTFVCCSKNCRASVSMGSVHRDNASCLESLEGFLQHVLQAPIMEGLLSIREQANEISKNSTGVVLQDVDVMRQLLKEVKNWTQVLLMRSAYLAGNSIPAKITHCALCDEG